MINAAEVRLWGRTIGAVSWDAERGCAFFQYTDKFARSGIEIAPLKMPLSETIFSFPELPFRTFRGLPGLLADSIPDKFGNALIDVWLAREDRKPDSFSSVERLCFIGTRGMGALEFFPTLGLRQSKSKILDVDSMVSLASEILTLREGFSTALSDSDAAALNDILRVGTSAGGARAKALIAWNEKTNEVRSGQVNAGAGYTYWLMKFDGVKNNKDRELADPKGYGLIEYAYYQMAIKAGIDMSECRIYSENSRNHFMTKRFDRTDDGGKIHMQSLCAMTHFDFNRPDLYSYEQALQCIHELNLGALALEQQFKRMCFNIVARNQDDHVKNIAFLMDRSGRWSLSPAFDLSYSYNPKGDWTSKHQMSMNGKRDGFVLDDFVSCGVKAQLRRARVLEILEQVIDSVTSWKKVATNVGVDEKSIASIGKTHRLAFDS